MRGIGTRGGGEEPAQRTHETVNLPLSTVAVGLGLLVKTTIPKPKGGALLTGRDLHGATTTLTPS
jgi:hypothetical protein